MFGLSVAMGFQFYAGVFDWNLNVGGKPDNSTLAFVPIGFELTVLFAGLATVAAFLLRAGLFPGAGARLLSEGITEDTFARRAPPPRCHLRRGRGAAAAHGDRRPHGDHQVGGMVSGPRPGRANGPRGWLALALAAGALGATAGCDHEPARARVHAGHGALAALRLLRQEPGDP